MHSADVLTAIRERGEFLVEHIRDGEVISSEVCRNFLANEGETAILDVFFRNGTAPSAFTVRLLSSSATPAEDSTWAALSTYEMNGAGNAPGYSSQSLSRDTTGWPTLDTVDLSGSGGEVVTARVSSSQKVITASNNWTAPARYLTVTATIGGAEKHVASAQTTADRQLVTGDQLSLIYRLSLR